MVRRRHLRKNDNTPKISKTRYCTKKRIAEIRQSHQWKHSVSLHSERTYQTDLIAPFLTYAIAATCQTNLERRHMVRRRHSRKIVTRAPTHQRMTTLSWIWRHCFSHVASCNSSSSRVNDEGETVRSAACCAAVLVLVVVVVVVVAAAAARSASSFFLVRCGG